MVEVNGRDDIVAMKYVMAFTVDGMIGSMDVFPLSDHCVLVSLYV